MAIDGNYKPIGATSCRGSGVNLAGLHLTALPPRSCAGGRGEEVGEEEGESDSQIEFEGGRGKRMGGRDRRDWDGEKWRERERRDGGRPVGRFQRKKRLWKAPSCADLTSA